MSPCASLALNLGVPCSGNGECVVNNQTGAASCVCDEGWSGRSDWFNREGEDCQIYNPAVLGLWSAQLGVILLAGALGWLRMSRFLRVWLNKRKEDRKHGRAQSLTKNRALVAMLFYWFGCWPFHVLLCVYKVAVPEEKIGVDIWPSLFWFMERNFFYMVGYFFQPALIRSLLRGRHDMDSFLTRKRVSLAWRLIQFSIMASGTLVFVPIIAPDGILPQVTLATFNVLMFVWLLSMALWSQNIRAHVDDIMGKSYEVSGDDRVLQIKDNLSNLQNEVTRQTSLQMFIFLTFGAWPFLWSKHDYFYPISITVMPVIGFKGIDLLLKNTQDKSSSGRSRRSTRRRKYTGGGNTLTDTTGEDGGRAGVHGRTDTMTSHPGVDSLHEGALASYQPDL